MIRSTLALSPLLLWSLLTPPVAIGQEPTNEGSPAGKPAVRTNPPSEAPALVPAANANDPFSAYYSFYLPAFYLPTQHSQAVAKPHDALETNFGLSLSDADDTLRAQLEIPPGQGVVVVGVKAGSLAEHAGLKLNDVLVSLGDQKAKSWGQVKDILLGLGKEAVEVKLIREGKASRMSLVGPKHGFPPEAAEYWIGTPVSPVDVTLRAHLPILPADSGLIVNDVVKGSPADQIGVKKDDILVSMDGKPLKNSDALIAQIQASQGKTVPLQVLRAGKPLTLTITPAKRTYPTVIHSRVKPEAQVTFQVVRPNMAIEFDPRVFQNQAGQESAQHKLLESKPTPSGGVTLYAPYSGILLDPYSGLQAHSVHPTTNPYLSSAVGQGWGFQVPTAYADPATSRIEGQLKEVLAKLESISKAVEGLKKSAER